MKQTKLKINTNNNIPSTYIHCSDTESIVLLPASNNKNEKKYNVKWMKYFFSFCILLILVNLAAKAQQEPLYSGYMLSRPVTNPGFVGAEKTINALFLNRTMFAGMGEYKPVTSMFGVEAPVEIFGTKSGLGIWFANDKVGYFNEVFVDVAYSYQKQLSTGKIGIGIKAGINNYSLTPGEEGWIYPDENSTGDELVPDEFSIIIPRLGLGIYYETSDYYIGLSASQINQANIKYARSEELEYYVGYKAAHYYLTGAYNIALPDPLFDLQPSFLLRTDLAAFSLDLNGTLYIKDKYWTGLGIRVSPANISAINLMGGLELVDGLNFGYVLDVNLGSMFLAGHTSHELMVTYSFNLDTKRNQKYKSVRYL